jgi:hypothetical protein
VSHFSVFIIVSAGNPGPREDIHIVPVRSVLLAAAVGLRDQATGDRRQRAAAGEDLIEEDHAGAQPDPQRLCLGDVATSSCASSWARTPASCTSLAFC